MSITHEEAREYTWLLLGAHRDIPTLLEILNVMRTPTKSRVEALNAQK
jgi:hypothetical protein